MKKVHVEVRCDDCDITEKDDVDTCFCFMWDKERGLAPFYHGELSSTQVEEAISHMQKLLLKARSGHLRRN